MNIPRNICILCSIETDFYISLMDNYCRKSDLLKKINICLCMSVKEDDVFNVICHNCVYNVEKYYDFVIEVRKAQTVIELKKSNFRDAQENRNNASTTRLYNKYVTSYVHEQLYDPDFSFCFSESMFDSREEVRTQNAPMPSSYKFEKRGEPKPPCLWNVKTQPAKYGAQFPHIKERKQHSLSNTSHQKGNIHRGETALKSSRDIFESPNNTQDAEVEPRSFDWKLTPDDNIMKKIREKCFGRLDF